MGPHAKRDARRRAGDLSEDEDEDDDDLHGVQLGRSSSTKGAHLGGGGSHNSLSTPKDETRRAARALRKGGGAGPDEDRSRSRSRSRSRARAGPGARRPQGACAGASSGGCLPRGGPRGHAQDSEGSRPHRPEGERARAREAAPRREGREGRGPVRVEAHGAGVGGGIVHVPRLRCRRLRPPAGPSRGRFRSGNDAAPLGLHSKRGSFASVAYSGGTGSSDEDDAASLASGRLARLRRRGTSRRSNDDVLRRRHGPPPKGQRERPDGPRLRNLRRGGGGLVAVHGGDVAVSRGEGRARLAPRRARGDGAARRRDDVAARFESVGVPAMAKTPSELAEAAAAAARKRGFGGTTRDEDEADEDEADEDETLDEAAAEEAPFEDGTRRRRRPSRGRRRFSLARLRPA